VGGSGLTGVAGGDMPTIELTAADVGDTDDDDEVFFVAAVDGHVLVVPVLPGAIVERAFAVFSTSDVRVFELLSVAGGCVFVPPLLPSGGRVLTPYSVSCDERFLEVCDMGDGGGCSFDAGTRLLACFRGEEVTDGDVTDLAGDGVSTRSIGVEGLPSLSGSSASRPSPSTHVGLDDDVFMCFDPVVSSRRLRLAAGDHRSVGST